MEIPWGHKRGHQTSERILSPCSLRLSFEPSPGRPMALSGTGPLQPLQLWMFLPRTALCVLESYSTVFSTARRSGLFLLIRGFPCSIDEAPQRPGAPREAVSKPRGLALYPDGEHTSISPWSTRLAALPNEHMWALRHGLISIAVSLVPLCSPSHAWVPACSPAPINGSSRRCPCLAAGVRRAGCERTAGAGFAGAFRQKIGWSPGAGCLKSFNARIQNLWTTV